MVTSTRRVRVGLVGSGRLARFHLQRLSLRSDLRPVAVAADFQSAGQPKEQADKQADGCRVVSDASELLSDTSLDVVLVTGSVSDRFETVRQAIELGRPIAVPSPLSASELALCPASGSGPRLLVLSNCLADDDFQSAWSEIRSGRLGRPLTFLHSTWGLVGSESSLAAEASGLPVSLLDRLEQLLLFGDLVPLSVSARRLCGAGSVRGIGLAIRFADGVTACLEHHPSSAVSLATGWVIAGSVGGYRDFELFRVTGAEEVYGTPLESGSIDLDRVYDDLLLQWDDEVHRAGVLARADRLVRLLSSVELSLAGGSEVAVDVRG